MGVTANEGSAYAQGMAQYFFTCLFVRLVAAAACLGSDNSWRGAINTSWENAGNWSCGSLPDAQTDVIINGGLPNYPVINSAATCRSINEAAGSSLKVNSSFQLTITGSPGD